MTSTLTRPVCDEWGLYDPEQAGFEAIVRRLLPHEDDARGGIVVAPERRGVHSPAVTS